MAGTVWTKFYWSDWESDERLKLCSPAAQGLWMRMLCICAKSEPIGYLMVQGQPLAADDMATLTGWPAEDVRRWWDELAKWGVFSVDAKGRPFSRRMIADEKKAKIARKNGKGGGNPKLRKNTGNPPSDNPPDKGRVKGRDKTHMPYANSQTVEATNIASTVGAEGRALSEARPSRAAWAGPSEIRDLVVAAKDENYARSWFDPCAWRDLPERAVIARTSIAFERLRRDLRRVLAAEGVTLLFERGEQAA